MFRGAFDNGTPTAKRKNARTATPRPPKMPNAPRSSARRSRRPRRSSPSGTARQAGGRALWLYPTIGAAIRRQAAVVDVLLPGVRAVWLGRPTHATPRRSDLWAYPLAVMPAVLV